MTKGLEMPINILVAIAVAVIILIGVVMLIGPQIGAFGGGVSLESAKTRYCGAYVRQGCVDSTTSPGYSCAPGVNVTLSPAIDADGNGAPDTLYVFMGKYSGVASQSECKKACGCPGY